MPDTRHSLFDEPQQAAHLFAVVLPSGVVVQHALDDGLVLRWRADFANLEACGFNSRRGEFHFRFR